MPPRRVSLQPGEDLERELTIQRGERKGRALSINHGPLMSGTYRIVYWGVPGTDAVLADHVDEFDHGW